MKRENWPLPEQQSANMVMCEENVSQLESGAQIAEAGEEDGKKRFGNEIEKEVLRQCLEVLQCLHLCSDRVGAVAARSRRWRRTGPRRRVARRHAVAPSTRCHDRTRAHHDAVDAMLRAGPSLKKKINLVREKLDDPIIASGHEKPSTVLSFLESNQDFIR